MGEIGHFRVPPGLCFKTRVGAQPLIWKSFFILMQIKLIFIRKVVHLASFWKWGFLELESGPLTNTRLRRGFKLFPSQRSSLAINQRINKGITVTTVTVTYGNIWFYNKWIFQRFFLCSHRYGYRVECEIELLVHNTDCTLTIETTGQNPIHRSLKTGIAGFYGCVSKYIYWILSGSIEVSS